MKWLALAVLLPLTATAQDFYRVAPNQGAGAESRAGTLDATETAKLVALRRAVFTAHPDWIAARVSDYQRLMENQDAYISDPSILRDLAHLQMQIEAEMVKMDPTAGPLLAKFHSPGSRWGVHPAPGAPSAPPVAPPVSTVPANGSSTEPQQVDIPPAN